MIVARIKCDRDFRIAEIDDRLYGSFIEHLGRQVYEGVYEPGHPTADDMGFRQDVMDLTRELGPTIMRYPGGNFVSAYNWEDGVGPIEKRPKRLDVVWDVMEPNHFGTNEFCEWCRRVGVDPMMAVNMGTRGLDAARNLVEYCNHPGGSYWSDLRISHGYKEPHKIKVWCMGNEMDGQHQMGYKPPETYGAATREAAKLMKMVDPTIELAVVGGCVDLEWNTPVLEHVYDHVDLISIHTYLQKPQAGTLEFMARPVWMENVIKSAAQICDYTQARKRSKKQLHISLDEWNVWWREAEPLKSVRYFHEKPQHYLEEVYSAEDAVVVGLMLIVMIRNSDRVKVGCFSELVNSIACITTAAGGPAWRQATFWPFALASKFGRGTALNTLIDSPTYESHDLGTVKYLDSVAVLDDANERLTIFAVNKSPEDEITVACDTRGVGEYEVVEQWVLTHNDPVSASNTMENPDNVRPGKISTTSMEDGKLSVVLPKVSFNVVRLRKKR